MGHKKHGHASHGSSHSSEHYKDPAAAKLIDGIRKSMIGAADPVKRQSVKGDGTEKMITENLQAYLSRADQFATRMSQLVRASQIKPAEQE
jgi:hypothetical protein